MTRPNMDLLRRVAPLVRGLLADGRTLPALKWEAGHGAPGIALPEDGDDTALLEALRAAIGGTRPGRVTVAGLGVLAVCEPVARSGRMAGKVALVTGGAQGFGLEIATALVAEGARVALADINLDGARAAAEQLCARRAEACAIALHVNVADSASVQATMDGIVTAWGGLDLLIANAGVLRAGGLDQLAEKDFDFVTSVNYKGYYLCVRAAAPILARQHLACPAVWSDIIQINSKSGLEGSKRNFAYAGGKFGGIGLTQSFALELVDCGVKVNSICPGNFFDGPLWSDPENGLFVQYLKAGKVPGAKTVEDVRRFYEAKVPMGRGCTGEDVMRAIYYLCEQQYETGQALPVTGGQVMLN